MHSRSEKRRTCLLNKNRMKVMHLRARLRGERGKKEAKIFLKIGTFQSG
jgi:hypothetical protein